MSSICCCCIASKVTCCLLLSTCAARLVGYYPAMLPLSRMLFATYLCAHKLHDGHQLLCRAHKEAWQVLEQRTVLRGGIGELKLLLETGVHHKQLRHQVRAQRACAVAAAAPAAAAAEHDLELKRCTLPPSTVCLQQPHAHAEAPLSLRQNCMHAQ
jgi:hypothetical protein